MTEKIQPGDLISKLVVKNVPVNVSNSPDQTTKKEQEEYERQAKKFKLEKNKSEHEQRKLFAKKLFNLSRIWIGVMLVIVMANGVVFLEEYFRLSDKVLIALMTSSTVAVLGLFLVVLKYLFGSNSGD